MMKSNAQQTLTVQEIIDFIKREYNNETIEGTLLKKKMIKELYKQIGDININDYGDDIKRHGTYWYKMDGYTTNIEVMTEQRMKSINTAPTSWNIKRASYTKMQIVEDYTRDGWNCTVQSYNVLCNKFVPHPKYKDIWVRFYSSRDCNKYEYIIKGE